MPDTGTAGKGSMAFLKEKAGPLPLWAWLAIGVAMVLYIREKQSGGSLSSLFGGSSSSASAVPNQQTDPAGNIGTIDPATGYVYGTPEDLAALAANNAGTSSGTSGGTGTVGGSYADNNTWGVAAINYLVGLGIDPTTANEAIESFLASQPLTSVQQADVNLAIEGLGAPPQPPGPVGNTPAPTTTPPPATTPPPTINPGGPVTTPATPTTPTTPAAPPAPKVPATVTGLKATSTGSTSIGLAWNKSANATSYQVRVTYQDNVVQTDMTSGTSYTVSGLTPDHTYGFHVVAINGSNWAPEASISQKTSK
jgi:hypothetical protein